LKPTLLLLFFARAQASPCQACHPKEVEGYSHYGMAHSLRRAGREPSGSLENDFGTKFTVYSNAAGTWQRIERGGEASDYRVAYVIGSGNHASGYLVRIGDHLFQSPLSYYTARRAYGMAPGYEKLTDADFTRPVTEECLLCHSGRPRHISGTVSGYESPAFDPEAISCERCHGPTAEHLRRPVPGSIVNPGKLQGAARDSICEQCHLSGVIRIPNPGKKIEDFRPGLRLEDVFTVYRFAAPPGSPAGQFKVISHSEQLAASACARNSNGKLWCGVCHDPHNKPVQPVSYYRERCLSCHARKISSVHAAPGRDCVGCHMPRRETSDGGHTVFTDHRIMRRPDEKTQSAEPTELAAWREPDPAFAIRSLALAYINAGSERNSAAWMVRGYRLLTEVQNAFRRDPATLRGFGTALLEGNRPREAKIAFDGALAIDPSDPVNEENAGRADLACGEIEPAAEHFEQALRLDPLLLSSAELLEAIYQKRGDSAKETALAERLRAAMGSAGIRPKDR